MSSTPRSTIMSSATLDDDLAELVRWVKSRRFPEPLRCCYESDPTGFGLHRTLEVAGSAASSRSSSLRRTDRQKTDGYDAERLACHLACDLRPRVVTFTATTSACDVGASRGTQEGCAGTTPSSPEADGWRREDPRVNACPLGSLASPGGRAGRVVEATQSKGSPCGNAASPLACRGGTAHDSLMMGRRRAACSGRGEHRLGGVVDPPASARQAIVHMSISDTIATTQGTDDTDGLAFARLDGRYSNPCSSLLTPRTPRCLKGPNRPYVGTRM